MPRSTQLEALVTNVLENRIQLLENDQHVPVTLADSSLELVGQILNVNLDSITNGGNNLLTLTANGLYVSPSGSSVDLSVGTQTGTTLEISNTAGNNVILPSATTLLAGLLNNTDKTKLDGIENGATADQTASEVPVIPTGNLTSTDVQAGLVELQGDIDTLSATSHAAVTLGGLPGDTTDDTIDLSGQIITINLVTPITDGVMSSSDKTKLDGIANNANNYTHPNHTGDVVSIGDGIQTIQPNVVDNTKLSDIEVNTIKGRITLGTGDPEDLTPSQVRTIINVQDGAQVNPVNTDSLSEGSTNLYYTEARVSANTDVSANTSSRHDAVTIADDSLEITGQNINVNIDNVTANNALVLTLGQGLYVDGNGFLGTDLGIASQTGTTLDITSSSGNNATILSATGTLAGLLSSSDKTKLDGIANNANNYTHPNHTGDVVSIGDGVQTIQPNVVDNTKLSDMTSGTIKGRNTAGIGDPEDLTSSQVRAIINVENGATADQTASEVPVIPTGNLTSTDVQAGLVELQGDIDTLSATSHAAVTINNDGLTLTGQDLGLNLDTVTGGNNNILDITLTQGLYLAPIDLSLGTINGTSITIDNVSGTGFILPTATTLLAGLLSGTDKTKLDGIENGATADQTASEVPVIPTGNLTSTDVQAGLVELQGDIDTLSATSHAAVTINNDGLTLTGQDLGLNLDTVTGGNIASITIGEGLYIPETDLSLGTITNINVPINSSTGNDIITLPAATATLAGITTANTQTFGGRKTFQDDKILIDPIDATSPGGVTFEIGWFNDLTPADPNSFGFRRSDGGGVFSWGSNANITQFFLGDPNGTGEHFIDGTNNTDLNLNVLDTGTNDPGRVNIGIGGLTVLGSSEIVATNPLEISRDDTTPILSFIVESDGTLTTGDTVNYDQLVLDDNDIPNRKWVADRMMFGTFPVCRNASLATPQSLRRQNGTFNSSCPYIVPYDAEIYKVTAENNPSGTTQTWQAEVEVNSVVVATVAVDNTVDHKAVSPDLDININEGDEVVIFFRNPVGNTPNPGCVVYFRSRI